MNTAAKCHKIDNCELLYVDAFKSFKAKTQDSNSAFILTHYHSDHYVGLPKGSNYVGPALIHCTPITARILRQVHHIQDRFICEHSYGTTWSHYVTNSKVVGKLKAEITFYDANHCPGACIVLVHFPSLQSYHLHTGDMRYLDPQFRQYPLLKQAITERKLDCLYLDTTYCHPRHTFPCQDTTVQQIANRVHLALKDNITLAEKKTSFFERKLSSLNNIIMSGNTKKTKTLVLLSCYSIGKEKVLYQSATLSNQFIYVDKNKYKMLQCIHIPNHNNQNNTECHHPHISTTIIQKCTQDPKQSDIHVVPMNTAGSMFPFFKPNFDKCAAYAKQCDNNYTKVVAFIPTGWAAEKSSSTVTKKKSDDDLSSTTTTVSNLVNGIHVEINLVPYSEHSSFDELRLCVSYIKPRQVIPTVFSNAEDYARKEKLFHDLVDGHRAKMAFIETMKSRNSYQGKNDKNDDEIVILSDRKVSSSPTNVYQDNYTDEKIKSSIFNTSSSLSSSPHTKLNENETVAIYSSQDSNDLNVKELNSPNSKRRKVTDNDSTIHVNDEHVALLLSMGFDESWVNHGLKQYKNDLQPTIDWLLKQSTTNN